MKTMKIIRAGAAVLLALALSGCAASAAAVTEQPSEPEILTAVRYLDPAERESGDYLRRMTTTAFYTLEDGVLTAGLGALPEDVTADYAGTYGVPEDEVRGYAFRITLREDVFWETGEAVDADDVLATLETRLSSDLIWLANAPGYLEGREREAENVISLAEAGFSSEAEARAAGYTRFYVDAVGFWGLEAGWESVSDRTRIRDYAMPDGLDEFYVTPAYLYRGYLAEGTGFDYLQGEFLGVTADREDVLTLADVGLVKTGDHELVLISGEPVTAQTVAARLMDLTLTDDRSYGPYRVASEGEELILERNPAWMADTEAYPADRITVR